MGLALVLSHLNFEALVILETDASNYTTGAVLLQVSDDGVENPISFISKKMKLAKKNCHVYNNELLAIMEALG